MSGDVVHAAPLPAGWEWVSIGETGEYINGFAFKPSQREGGGLPIVRIQNLTDESKVLNTTTLDVPVEYKIDTGAMLMSWSATLDVFVWRRGPALVNQHIFKVVPDEKVMQRGLLFFWLKQAIQQLQKTDHLHGSTMMHINRGPFMAHLVPLPPAAEQTRIVAKLEELLSDLDAGVAELKAAQKKLAQYRQSLLKAAVEGALTAEWRAQNPPLETGAQLLQRMLAERRAHWEAQQLARFEAQGKAPPKGWQGKYPEAVGPSTARLPELPIGWIWASVDQLSPDDLANGRSVPSAENGARVLRLTAVKNGRIDLTEFKRGAWNESEARPFAVSQGDLLIVRGNGSLSLVGRTGLVGHVTQQVAYPDTLIRLRVVERVASAAWVGMVWNSPVVRTHLERRARTSAGIYKISQPDITSAVIPVPPLREQEEILRLLDQHDEGVSSTEATLAAAFQQSTAQRQNLLRAAFAGQLVPQDPADEPAAELLARIRAERAALAPQRRRRAPPQPQGAHS